MRNVEGFVDGCGCPFCRDYETTREVNTREIREAEKEGIKRRFRYRVRMIEYPERFIYSWQNDGQFGHKPMKLNYCPVCGRKLV